ncbi:MAG: cytochrome c oxidase subunit II [Anaeromyxobacteraceae bacterium]
MSFPQSTLAPAGPQAQQIADLGWTFFAVCAVVWVAVLATLAWGIFRRRAGADPGPVVDPGPRAEARTTRVVAGLVGATAVTLIVLVGLSTRTGNALAGLGLAAPLTVEVTGHQWWWELRYVAPVPSQTFTTANELHLPAGIPVRLVLRSRDVIHSLWIPALHGKKDLVPGRDGELTLVAAQPGIYRGQCAEFCGVAHAEMAIRVVVEPREDFDRWRAAQRLPALEPATAEAHRGKDVFLRGACATCHRIAGTPAGATLGPDLTHLAGRRSLGAGTLPNTRGHLAGWIANAQAVKPGNHMPPQPLEPADLQALLAFLEGLK